ncbi:jerky protein homolog-like [Anastrepha ludens]|uniref:jerky protein homolog-like n=1 Tax=Anastrepha ludens TaxID=28586 RepID=UPI0023AF51BB|nr:jerky protein homolog-like [Anastrepha ludens]
MDVVIDSDKIDMKMAQLVCRREAFLVQRYTYHQRLGRAFHQKDEHLLLPEKTYASSLEKRAPGVKFEKQRIMFLCCSNATGSHKLKLLVIGKAKNLRCFKNFQCPTNYKSSKFAWMASAIFKQWFHESFVPQVTSFLKEKALPIKALLLIDNASSHPNEAELTTENGQISAMFMPPNVTPLIQPMDQNAIKITKLYYRNSILASIAIYALRQFYK